MVLADAEGISVLRASTDTTTNSLYIARGHGMAPAGVLLASERLDDDPAWKVSPSHWSMDLTAT
jgi:hypothetical protein